MTKPATCGDRFLSSVCDREPGHEGWHVTYRPYTWRARLKARLFGWRL